MRKVAKIQVTHLNIILLLIYNEIQQLYLLQVFLTTVKLKMIQTSGSFRFEVLLGLRPKISSDLN